jgi:phosphomannomutase / phosphoglucomutase
MTTSNPVPEGTTPGIPAEIFKAYDIRGIVDRTLTEAGVETIGRALATLGNRKGVKKFVVGRDGRLSGPRLAQALARGLAGGGMDVVDIGVVATPMVYFATYHFETGSGVMVTGSHNPPDYNGLKMMVAGETLAAEAIQDLRRLVESGDFVATASPGTQGREDISGAYIDRIVGDVKIARPMTIAVDCGNGSPGAFAPALYRKLGCKVIELFCEVDGNFPNHHPDPSKPENLEDLIHELKTGDAELGLAFDGDGDRLGVVTKAGKIIYPDRQLMLFAADVLGRNPGAEIVFDVKCTRNLFPWVRKHGGKPTIWKTGHSLIKAKLRETGAPLAGEMSGHVFFKERWYGFDDGLYAGARLLEILSREKDVAKVLDALPESVSTPELQVPLEREGENHKLIAELQKSAHFPGATEVLTIDGLRVEYPDGFGLMRASNTTPVLVLRFEADTPEALARIQRDFKQVLSQARPGAALPY